MTKSTRQFINIRSHLLAGIRWSVCTSKSQRMHEFILLDVFWFVHKLFVSIVRIQSLRTLPVDLTLWFVLYSFCARLLLSLMGLIVSFPSRHKPTLTILCYVLSIFALVLMMLLCAAFRRALISFLRFSFRSYVQVFLCTTSPFCHLKYPYSYFSSHSCFFVFAVFLSVLILPLLQMTAAINLSFFFS